MNLDELHRVCLPVVEYMKKNCSPHDAIVITDEQYKIVADEVVVPVSGFGELADVLGADVQTDPWTRQREIAQKGSV